MEKRKKRIYDLVKKIPRGKITTYKIIAKKIKTSPRVIGQVLKKNSYGDVPCHRVVMSNGFVGGYHGQHFKEKITILRREGVVIKNKKIQNFNNVLFDFN